MRDTNVCFYHQHRFSWFYSSLEYYFTNETFTSLENISDWKLNFQTKTRYVMWVSAHERLCFIVTFACSRLFPLILPLLGYFGHIRRYRMICRHEQKLLSFCHRSEGFGASFIMLFLGGESFCFLGGEVFALWLYIICSLAAFNENIISTSITFPHYAGLWLRLALCY